MDSDNASDAKRRVSVLQGDEFIFNKVISRNSSFGCSSRLFYYRSSEGVPFQWEMQPGKPKNPPEEDILPPLSPPPAILSLGLPKPCIHDIEEEPKVSLKSRLKFWKHINKKVQGRKKMKDQEGHKGNNNNNNNVNCNNSSNNDNFESFEFCSSDGDEFIGSPVNLSSSSSSFSSLSLSNGDHSRKPSELECPAAAKDSIHGFNGCSPLKFNSILVCIAKRV